ITSSSIEHLCIPFRKSTVNHVPTGFDVGGLTPELSCAAKRRRLECLVRLSRAGRWNYLMHRQPSEYIAYLGSLEPEIHLTMFVAQQNRVLFSLLSTQPQAQ